MAPVGAPDRNSLMAIVTPPTNPVVPSAMRAGARVLRTDIALRPRCGWQMF